MSINKSKIKERLIEEEKKFWESLEQEEADREDSEDDDDVEMDPVEK